MKSRVNGLASMAVLALALALAVGCGVDEAAISDAATSASVDDNAPSLATTEQSLIVFAETFGHGGNFTEQTYSVVKGKECGSGRTRNWARTTHTGGGNCWVIGWESTDVNDCRVRVGIKDSAMWVWGNCTLTVDASAADSCASRCGQRAPAGCFCDPSCRTYGDCCRDYTLQCP